MVKEMEREKNIMFDGEYLFNHKIKGKEYIKEKLIYEGEYIYDRKLNGKGYDEINNEMLIIKNGNGKAIEYFNGLIYKGEFKNGKRNGRGKEYSLDNKLIYEGEFKNGRRNGKGKEYHYEGFLIFEGEYLEGKRWEGFGKVLYLKGIIQMEN